MKYLKLVLVIIFLAFTACSSKKIDLSRNLHLSKFKESANIGFLMEIPVGSNKKYEFSASNGQLFLDRQICSRKANGKNKTIEFIPASYGISPGRFNIDGDPLDLLILGANKFYQSYEGKSEVPERPIRVIGLLKFDECNAPPCKEWEQDWKVLGVDIEDQFYNTIYDTSDLSQEIKTELIDFFANYKGNYIVGNKKYPKTRVTGFASRVEADKFIDNFSPKSKAERENEIKICNNYYEDLTSVLNYLKPEDSPKDELLMNCINNVWPKNLLQEQYKKAYLNYSALQILHFKLKVDGVNLGNAIKRLDKLKENKKKTYRFVAYDSPKPPATGNPIFSWIKTLDRSEGCFDDFKTHYKHAPIVDYSSYQD